MENFLPEYGGWLIQYVRKGENLRPPLPIVTSLGRAVLASQGLADYEVRQYRPFHHSTDHASPPAPAKAGLRSAPALYPSASVATVG